MNSVFLWDLDARAALPIAAALVTRGRIEEADTAQRNIEAGAIVELAAFMADELARERAQRAAIKMNRHLEILRNWPTTQKEKNR